MLQPDLVRAFVAEYHATREELRKARYAERAVIERARAKVSRRIGRLTDMMADGVGNYEEMKARLKAALTEREEIDRRLESVEVAPAVALHPGIADAFKRNIKSSQRRWRRPRWRVGRPVRRSVTSSS